MRFWSRKSASFVATCFVLGCITVACTGHAGTGAPGQGHAGTGHPSRAESSRVTFRQINGGPAYFSRLSHSSAWMDQHILLGAWLEQPTDATDVGYDRATGDNIYWNLAGTDSTCGGAPCVASYQTIRDGGMHVSAPTATGDSGSESTAFEGTDEPDVDLGPGWGAWDRASDTCVPADAKCGYTAARFFYSGQPAKLGSLGYPTAGSVKQQGFGKGVLFWETATQAAGFLRYSDILSADSYWMTDSSLGIASQGGCALFPKSPVACGDGAGPGLTPAQRKLPANYAYNVTDLEKLQARNGPQKPILVDIETGCPLTNSDSCTTPEATIAAAWHALIAGARGIIWFQHNFGGPCIDFHTVTDGSDPASQLYNCQQTPGVTLHTMVTALTQFNARVDDLNTVLLSPFADGYVHSSADVSYMAKYSRASYYIFAASGKPGTPPPANQRASFSINGAHNCRVSVLGENRTIPVIGGKFSDTFGNADSVHIYRVEC